MGTKKYFISNHIQILFFLMLPFITINNQCAAQSIIKTNDPDGWLIKTNASAYQMILTTSGELKEVYYGPVMNSDQRNDTWVTSVDEVPVRGGSPFNTPALEVVFKDGVRALDLQYVSGEAETVDNHPVLKIVQKDRYYPLQVISYIKVFPKYNILEKWMEIKNTGRNGDVKIENALSGSIVLPENQYELTQLSGKPMNEFQLYQGLLTPGLKIIQNKTFKSNFNPPWFAVHPQSSNGKTVPVWFGSLHYSGNWVLKFDQAFDGRLQILGGINFWDTDIYLKSGESFTTPKLTIGFTTKGLNNASQCLSAYIKKDILPEVHRKDLRPVIFNSYYADALDVNTKILEEQAEQAARLGVELFVIDDGWFKGRKDSNSGLGDWTVDSTKFPGGFTPLIQKVNALGMKFGIWVEPENVDVNSDLFRAHPDWVLGFPHRKANPYRRILNLAKPEVFHYLLTSLTKLLKENNIAFVKWDQNNFLSDPGWPDAPPEETRSVRIKYIQNLYRLVDTLKKRFPKVWFESCSSGGGRVDLGMMSHMDLAWVSDNTYALNRMFIQYGYLSCMPANTMVSFVVDKIGNYYRQPTSLNFRFDVAMSGILGISTDIDKWTTAEKELADRKIREYKLIRPLVQQGMLYRLISPFKTNRCALQYINARKDSSVVFCYQMAAYLPGSQVITRGSHLLKLRGLQPDAKYLLKDLDDTADKGRIISGDVLMNVGIDWPVKEANGSKIMMVSKVK